MNCNPLIRIALVCVASIFLASGSAFAVNPISYLVADTNGDPYGQAPGTGQIDAFDANGGFLGAVVTGLTTPSGLTIGPNGYLYVANHNTGPNNGQILVYDPNNNFAPINSGSIVNGVFASGLNGPGGVLSDGNTLFVSELGDIGPFQGNLIKRYNAAGTLVSDTNNPLSSGAVTGLSGMAFDAAGNLFVGAFAPPTFAGAILEFSKTATTNPEFGATPTIFATGAPGASGLVYHDGTLFVADQLGATVAGYDSLGNLIPSTVITGLSFPSGLHDMGNGTMLVTESGQGSPTPGQIDIYNYASGVLTPGFITGTGVQGAIFQPVAAIAVPEPATAVLLACGLGMLMGGRMLSRRGKE